jgi:hypothetical protein
MVAMLPSTLSVMQIPEAGRQVGYGPGALFMPQFHGRGVKLRG